MSNIVWSNGVSESVWDQLPGGPSAWNAQFGEAWQYRGTIPEVAGSFRHEFRHRAHPLYGDFRLYAHVLEDDTGPRLDRLICFVDNNEPFSPGRGVER